MNQVLRSIVLALSAEALDARSVHVGALSDPAVDTLRATADRAELMRSQAAHALAFGGDDPIAYLRAEADAYLLRVATVTLLDSDMNVLRRLSEANRAVADRFEAGL